MARHKVGFCTQWPACAHSMKPREISAGPLPLTRPRHGRESTCSISLTCQTTNSTMSSTPPREVSCVKQRRFQGLPSGKKLDTSIQCQSGHVASNTFVRRTDGFIERTQAGPWSAKKPTLCRAMCLCCDGPETLRQAAGMDGYPSRSGCLPMSGIRDRTTSSG